MDSLKKSLKLIKKHLKETPVAERSSDWQEIAKNRKNIKNFKAVSNGVK